MKLELIHYFFLYLFLINIVSLVLFAVSSVLCAFATGIPMMVACRFLQGLAGVGGLVLARAMADALPDRDFDCLTPVPLHARRLRVRGYNQSLLLCRELSARTGILVVELLKRDKYHRPQSLTPQSLRQRNVAGAFSCAKDAEGLRVLLVDDVRTTGSTAFSCAKTLMDAGAESVSLCVAAVVYRGRGNRH